MNRKDTARQLVSNGFVIVADKLKSNILNGTGALNENAIKTIEQVDKVWSDNDYNISILTGANSLVVIDVDDHKNNGKAHKMFHEQYTLPKTLTVKSPTGKGVHYYYKSDKYSKKSKLGSKNTMVEDVEILTGNSKVSFASSVKTVTDANYGLIEDVEYKIIDAFNGDVENITASSIAELTGDALKFVEESYNKAYSKEINNSEQKNILNYAGINGVIEEYSRIIHDGERNKTLFELACKLRGYGINKDDLYLYVQSINENFCTPVIDEKEIKGIISSAIKRVKPNTKLIQQQYKDAIKTGNTENIQKAEQIITDTLGVSNPALFKYRNDGEIKGIIESKVVEEIVKNENVMFYNDNLWFYTNGYYVNDVNNHRLRHALKRILPDEFIEYKKIVEIQKHLKTIDTIAVKESEINDHPNELINVKNGMFNVLTGELTKHDHKYKSINQMDFEVDMNLYKDAETKGLSIAPTFEKFITKIADDTDDVQMLTQFVSTAFTKSRKVKSLLWLYGLSNTGKSTLIRLITKLVGEENYSTLGLRDMNGDGARFQTQKLQNKTLNVSPEESKNALKFTDIIKKLTGNDKVKAEYKGGKTFDFYPYSKLIIASNELPSQVQDNSDAFYNRLRIFESNKNTEIGNIKHLDEKLIKEKDQIIMYLLTVLKDVIKREWKILDSKNSIESKENLKMLSDTVGAFVDEILHRTGDKDHRIKRTTLYKFYQGYCNDIGEQSMSNRKFYERCNELGVYSKKMNDADYFYGIKTKTWETIKSDEFTSLSFELEKYLNNDEK